MKTSPAYFDVTTTGTDISAHIEPGVVFESLEPRARTSYDSNTDVVGGYKRPFKVETDGAYMSEGWDIEGVTSTKLRMDVMTKGEAIRRWWQRPE